MPTAQKLVWRATIETTGPGKCDNRCTETRAAPDRETESQSGGATPRRVGSRRLPGAAARARPGRRHDPSQAEVTEKAHPQGQDRVIACRKVKTVMRQPHAKADGNQRVG